MRKTSTSLIVVLLILSSFALVPQFYGSSGAYLKSNWRQIERGSSYVVSQDLENPVLFSWESAPQWVWNGTDWVPHIITFVNATENNIQADGYIQVQSGLIAARIHRGEASFWDPNMAEVRVASEIWEVQKGGNNKSSQDRDWLDATKKYSFTSVAVNESCVVVTNYYTSDLGELSVSYIFWEGSALKHTVVFTASEEGTYRVLQIWGGVLGAKVECEEGEIVVSKANTPLNSACFRFVKEDGSLSVYEDQSKMCYYPNGTRRLEHRLMQPVVVGFNATDSRFFVDYVFADWTLAKGMSLTVDPDTMTLDDPTVDGSVRWESFDGGYYRETSSWWLPFGWQAGDYGDWIESRTFIEWTLPRLQVSVTKVEFRYHGYEHWCNSDIRAMSQRVSDYPNTQSGNQALFNDCGDGTAYLSNNGVFPEVGAGKNVGGSGPSWSNNPKTDLQNAILGKGWFAFGFKGNAAYQDKENRIYSEEYASANPRPTLYFEYTYTATASIKSWQYTGMVGQQQGYWNLLPAWKVYQGFQVPTTFASQRVSLYAEGSFVPMSSGNKTIILQETAVYLEVWEGWSTLLAWGTAIIGSLGWYDVPLTNWVNLSPGKWYNIIAYSPIGSWYLYYHSDGAPNDQGPAGFNRYGYWETLYVDFLVKYLAEFSITSTRLVELKGYTDQYKPSLQFKSGEPYFPCDFYFDGNTNVWDNQFHYPTDLGAKLDKLRYFVHIQEYAWDNSIAEAAIAIEYWYYYVADSAEGWIPGHTHDWEVFIIFLKQTNPSEVLLLKAGQHGGLVENNWGNAEKEGGTHALLYIDYKHAMYYHAPSGFYPGVNVSYSDSRNKPVYVWNTDAIVESSGDYDKITNWEGWHVRWNDYSTYWWAWNYGSTPTTAWRKVLWKMPEEETY